MDPRVVVVGGGIAGLVLARALSTRGVPVDVVERAQQLSTVGAGITLGANAMRIFERLGLAAELERRGRRLRGGVISDARGRVLSSANLDDIEARYGRSLAIERVHLHAVLHAAVSRADGAPVALRFGTTVARLDESSSGIVCTLSDGTRLAARAVVGADGIRSRVRDLVWGPNEPAYAGYTCWRWTGRVPDGVPELVEMWGAGARVGLVPLPEDDVYAFFVANAPRYTPLDPAQRRASFVRHRFRAFGGAVPRVLAALGDDSTELAHHDIEEVVQKPWVKGRVALAGDAAHAMTPNLGQGAAMAIEDVSVLAHLLAGEHDTTAALAAYEARRRPRVDDIQRRSRTFGAIAQWQAPLAVWARNTALRHTPERATRRTIERIVSDVSDAHGRLG
jgi:2-heptyl-3-hydroxy-4(1H)-quinolone synthase